MIRYLIILIVLLFFSGCVNQQGVSAEYYDDCHIEYDYYGTYQKVCPYNIYNYKEPKKKDCLQCN